MRSYREERRQKDMEAVLPEKNHSIRWTPTLLISPFGTDASSTALVEWVEIATPLAFVVVVRPEPQRSGDHENFRGDRGHIYVP